MKKVFNNITFLIIGFIIISCGTGRIDNLERKPDEAIVIAKMRIRNLHENITNSATIFFDKSFWGTLYVKADDSSYIYLTLPIGRHYLSSIAENIESQGLPSDLITFELPESKIYYIGEINMRFNLDKNWGIYFGLLGQLLYDSRPVIPPFIFVEDNYEDAKGYFTKLFPTDEIIYKSIAAFDSTYKIEYLNTFKTYVFEQKPDTLTKSYLRRKMK
ncbi:MAG: hypothetical protein RO257_04700 [Candidatus Kapabacteria bacterium]|nr:hypothetical protein [Candidatus Kapabacteria bacterium]